MNATASSPARVDNDYVWDQGASLPVMLQDVRTPSTGSASTTTYLYGLGLISETVGSTTHFYLADGLGSTTEVVEDDGDVANTYRYDVWGALRSSSGSVANQFDFTGEQADHNANRGLVYLRARHYDPALGRFLSRDPLPMGSRYAYVGNGPTRFVDRSGFAQTESSFGVAYADYCPGASGLYSCPAPCSGSFYHAGERYWVPSPAVCGEPHVFVPGRPRDDSDWLDAAIRRTWTFIREDAAPYLGNLLNPLGECQKLALGTLGLAGATIGIAGAHAIAAGSTGIAPPVAVALAVEGAISTAAAAGATAGTGYATHQACAGHGKHSGHD